MALTTTVCLLLGLGVLFLHATRSLLKRQKPLRPLPPGPRPAPIVGNISDLPPKGVQEWVHWGKFKAYGPISSITVLGAPIMILNDAETATELLVKRSARYSSRPRLIFASEMVGWEHILAMLTDGKLFRAYRKAMHPYMGSESAVSQFNSLQELEANRFLWRLLKDPSQFAKHIQKEAGAVILKIAYGYTIEPEKADPLVDSSNSALVHFSEAGAPGAWLVDTIPALKYLPAWFPGAGFKRTGQAWKEELDAVVNKPYAYVRKQMESGKYETSYLSNLFESFGFPPAGTEEELVAKWTSASLYTGGADTTVCAIECFFLAMTLYPEVQRKAQSELDRVLGGRLPRVADRRLLPYVDAVVKEVYRWHPVAPMGIPHMSTEDDEFNGLFIPKGSLILPNIWVMTHDSEIYHDPMTFKPERFLGPEPEKDPREFVFGFGRRICPGRFLADNTVFLSISQTLTAFDIGKVKENGVEVNVKATFKPGVISHPEPWKFQISCRSKQHEELILSTVQEHGWEPSDASLLEELQY